MTTLQQAEKEADKWLEDFVRDWKIAANAAYSCADKAIGQEAHDYWLLALAGNLVWAIAGFAAPPVSIGLRLVVAGAAVMGADTVTRVDTATREKPPTPEKLLSGRIAETADRMEKNILERRREDSWELGVALFDLDDADQAREAKKWLWERKVFPRIKYEERSKELHDLMVKNIESQVGSFKAQWHRYQQRSDERKCWVDRSDGMNRLSSKLEDAAKRGTDLISRYPQGYSSWRDFYARYEAASAAHCRAVGKMEFKPRLNFSVEAAGLAQVSGHKPSSNDRSAP